MTSELRVDKIIPTTGAPTNGGGGIVQVVFVEKTDAESLTSTSTPQLIPGLSATITPKFNTSKILVQVVFHASIGGNYAGHHLVLRRGGTDINIGDAAGSRYRSTTTGIVNYTSQPETLTMNYYHTPTSTNSTTYGIKIQNGHDSTNTLYVNRTHTDSDGEFFHRTISSMTTMEVAA